MLPSDCNLSTDEYVHHFITDPNTIRHFDWCLETIAELESYLSESGVREEDLENNFDDLKTDYYELQENYNELKSQYDTLLNSLIDVVDKFKD
jgi:hypothetical protein